MIKPYLSVIIPCYNEVQNLKRGVLKSLKTYLSKQKFTWEVIISDDGSTDESVELIEKQLPSLNGFQLLKNPHGGKPSALFYGIKKASGELVLFTDMDQSTPIEELDKLLVFAGSNYGAIIGSRGLMRKNFPLYRRIGSIVFVAIRKAFILAEISDTQCGFKLFKKDVIAKSFPKLQFFQKNKRLSGWQVTSYDVELLHIIKKMGYSIKEVVVVWEDRDVSKNKGGGLARYFRESLEMLGQITKVKFNDIRGKY